MPPRTRRRSRGPRRRWIALLLGAAGLLALLGVMAPALFMGWVRHHLQDDAFRSRLETVTGSRLDAQVQLAPLHWSGDEVRAASAGLVFGDGSRLEAHGLHLGIDWGAFRRGLWQIVGAGADQLDLEFDAKPSQAGAEPPVQVQTDRNPGGLPLPGWLRSWLPSRFAVDGARIQRFGLRHPGGWQLAGADLAISPWQQGEASLLTTVKGGTLTTPVRPPAGTSNLQLDLKRAVIRLASRDFHLQEAVLQRQDAEWVVRGRLQAGEPSWQATLEFQRVPLADWVTEDWRQRLTGSLAGEIQLEGKAPHLPAGHGKVRLDQGVLTALPILDRLAIWSGVERFKRLVLDVAEASVKGSVEELVFDPIVVASHGLMHLQGRLSVRGEALDGQFWLGVTPETLRWLPGAQQHVFTETHASGPAGLRWTQVRLTGTRQAPREDLSLRLVEGAGKAALELPGEVAAKGGALLLEPLLGKQPGKPTEPLKNATEAGSRAVESGVRLLENLGGLLGK